LHTLHHRFVPQVMLKAGVIISQWGEHVDTQVEGRVDIGRYVFRSPFTPRTRGPIPQPRHCPVPGAPQYRLRVGEAFVMRWYQACSWPVLVS
jgi:hypothetical protein